MARKELIFLSIDPDPDPDPAPLKRGGRGPRLAGLLPGPLRGLAMRTLLRRRCGAGPGALGRGLRGAEHADAARDGRHGRAQRVLRPPPGLVLRQLRRRANLQPREQPRRRRGRSRAPRRRRQRLVRWG